MLCSACLVKAYVAGYNGYHFAKGGEFLEQLYENDSEGLLSSSVNGTGINWHIYALNMRNSKFYTNFFVSHFPVSFL